LNAYIKGGIAAVVAAIAIYLVYQANEHKLPANQTPDSFKLLKKMENEGVPDFELERLDGSKLKLSDLKGKLVVVNFWASWCNPCVEEFPSMVLLGDKMKERVVVVAVSTDDNRADIETFVKLFKLPRPGFEIVWDKDKKVMNQYGVAKIPESFIVGTDGKLKRKFIGVENWSSDDALMYFRMLLNGGELPPPEH
jgi:peroxiredoxin